jgi:hypothetical protein
MSCNIDTGRTLPCRDSVGGLKNVHFINYDATDSIPLVTTVGSEDTVAFDGVWDATNYKYELKGTSSLTTNIQASRENGTVAFEQVLELTLPKLSKDDNYQIKLLAWGRPRIVVEDYNGNYFLIGRQHGADVTGGTIVTGAAMGDLSGYTLSFMAMELTPANLCTGTIATPT